MGWKSLREWKEQLEDDTVSFFIDEDGYGETIDVKLSYDEWLAVVGRIEKIREALASAH